MPAPLYASCHSLPDFFERFERFVEALEGKVRVSLGSIGETSARFSVESSKLSSSARYTAFKQETLDVGGALLTSIAVEQDGRSIEFQLAQWEQGQIPIEFDAKMVHRPWLSRLATCFELRSRPIEGQAASAGAVGGRDEAYAQAIRHFEEASSEIARTNAENVGATKAFLADATREFSRYHAELKAAFVAEQRERQQLFEHYLADSDKLDVRRHGVVRREILDRLEQLAARIAADAPLPEALKIRRRISGLCGFLLVFGLGLIGYGVTARPAERLLNWWDGRGWTLIPQPTAWPAMAAWLPEAAFGTGAVLILTVCWFWLRYLRQAQTRIETHRDDRERFHRDLLRMSWIAELYLEAADRNGGPNGSALPSVLLERFSRSLFSGDEGAFDLERWLGTQPEAVRGDGTFDELKEQPRQPWPRAAGHESLRHPDDAGQRESRSNAKAAGNENGRASERSRPATAK